ncbi:glycine zipper family protein [Helicobacter sp. MIT 03-1614]|uniref:glycine zipper family protein n=1 Tax=Helicobacter sp. MIT 03-1614 TaxID=1548147 RepID=UPI000513388F|nr:glycine zipper family protein [Helicobacter sp. MIT 03-1614]TLD86398.1 glycine zipper family protein [Helicobacter sp. MIT 03-1614]
MKTIYESDEIVVTQQDNLTYYMQINNQDKVSNDSSALTSAISAIRNAVWALDVYSNTKVQLIVVVLGSTPNALIMQNNPNNSQLKNFIVLNLDVIVGFSATKIAPKILNKALIGAGIGTLAGSIIPGLGNAAGATSGFIAGAGRVLFLAGVGYFSTAILSNIYDALEIDELYDYLKKNIFSSQNKYEQETLRNPTEQELKIVLSNIDSNSTSNDIDKLLHSFPNYLKQDSQQESHIPQPYLLSPLLSSFLLIPLTLIELERYTLAFKS